MGPRFGVEDVADIFQSIWAKFKDDTSAPYTTCSLPPFEGRLGYGLRSWVSSSTDASLKWYVQEEQGNEFVELSLKRSEFIYTNLNDIWLDGNDAPIATIYDNTLEPDQRKEVEYNPSEATQSFSHHEEDTLVDERRSNNSSTYFSESSEELPRPDSPTINFVAQPGILREYGSRTGLSPVTAQNYSAIDRAWPLPEAPFTNIHLDVPERHESRYSGPDRAGRHSEDVRGYRTERMPKWSHPMSGLNLDSGYQPRAYMPEGPYLKLESDSDNRHRNLAYAQGGRESCVLEVSENHPQSLDKNKSGVSPLHNQFGEYHQTTGALSALAPQVYTGNPDELNFSDHSTGGLQLAVSRNKSTYSMFSRMRSRIRGKLRGLYPE